MDKFDETKQELNESLKEQIRDCVTIAFESVIEEAKRKKGYKAEEEESDEEDDVVSEEEEEDGEETDGDEDGDDEELEEAAAGRLIHTETQGSTEAKVYWNSSLGEYTVRLFKNGRLDEKADYFTDDKNDAKQTAKRMARGR